MWLAVPSRNCEQTRYRCINFTEISLMPVQVDMVQPADDFQCNSWKHSNVSCNHVYPAEGYGIKYEGSFLEKSQSGCVQNCCHFVCLHHFWA